jgi:hypothetical protein
MMRNLVDGLSGSLGWIDFFQAAFMAHPAIKAA